MNKRTDDPIGCLLPPRPRPDLELQGHRWKQQQQRLMYCQPPPVCEHCQQAGRAPVADRPAAASDSTPVPIATRSIQYGCNQMHVS